MGGKLKRKITIVEGREANFNMAKQLVDAAVNNGFDARLVKSIDENYIIENRLDEVFSDFVIWRGAVKCSSAYAIERVIVWLNNSNKITINTKYVVGSRFATSNKFFQHGALSEDEVTRDHILPMFPAVSRESVERLLEQGKIKFPFVFKPDFGTRGLYIYLIKDKNELDRFNDNFPAFSIEPFVKSKYDWRVFALGGVALGVMKKVGDENNASNFEAKSAGWKRWDEADIDMKEQMMYLGAHASAASGLEYSGIDIIRDDDTGKLIILETNYSGGWQNGFEGVTGVNVPVAIVEWFADRAELFEKEIREAVQNYVEKRLKYISRAAQALYKEIISFGYKDVLDLEKSREVLNFKDSSLNERLKAAYVLVQNELSSDDKIRIQDLLSTIEKYEISGFGNFVGKDCGVMEDAIENTALYLAISSKL